MKKYLIGGIGALALLVTILANKALANSSFFLPSVQTSSATSTPQFLGVNAVNGTSTLVYDSYNNGAPSSVPNSSPNSGIYKTTDSAVLLVQSTASTSASIQKLYFQYSQDGIDWFDDYVSTSTSSRTVTYNAFSPNAITINGSAVASTTRFALSVFTPTRYVKAIVNATTASSSIWMQWVPRREAQ